MNPPDARKIERAITVDAPVDAVWKALTDATELTRWFPLRAAVSPGRGGTIHMEWDETYHGDSAIEIWEPGRHLRLGFPHHPPVLLATDYYLEGDRGRTLLRVVTSGFEEGADWDDWYAGVGAGWDFELRGLKHYLEHHRGRDRSVATARHPVSGEPSDVWNRLTGAGGWLEASGLTGAVVFRADPTQLVMTVPQLNNALLRVELEAVSRHAIVWLATWGLAREVVDRLNEAWPKTLAASLERT